MKQCKLWADETLGWALFFFALWKGRGRKILAFLVNENSMTVVLWCIMEEEISVAWRNENSSSSVMSAA